MTPVYRLFRDGGAVNVLLLLLFVVLFAATVVTIAYVQKYKTRSVGFLWAGPLILSMASSTGYGWQLWKIKRALSSDFVDPSLRDRILATGIAEAGSIGFFAGVYCAILLFVAFVAAAVRSVRQDGMRVGRDIWTFGLLGLFGFGGAFIGGLIVLKRTHAVFGTPWLAIVSVGAVFEFVLLLMSASALRREEESANRICADYKQALAFAFASLALLVGVAGIVHLRNVLSAIAWSANGTSAGALLELAESARSETNRGLMLSLGLPCLVILCAGLGLLAIRNGKRGFGSSGWGLVTASLFVVIFTVGLPYRGNRSALADVIEAEFAEPPWPAGMSPTIHNDWVGVRAPREHIVFVSPSSIVHDGKTWSFTRLTGAACAQFASETTLPDTAVSFLPFAWDKETSAEGLWCVLRALVTRADVISGAVATRPVGSTPVEFVVRTQYGSRTLSIATPKLPVASHVQSLTPKKVMRLSKEGFSNLDGSNAQPGLPKASDLGTCEASFGSSVGCARALYVEPDVSADRFADTIMRLGEPLEVGLFQTDLIAPQKPLPSCWKCSLPEIERRCRSGCWGPDRAMLDFECVKRCLDRH